MTQRGVASVECTTREAQAHAIPYGVRRQVLRSTLHERARSIVREAILDAANQEFIGHGFHSTKIATVAQLAGVSIGTVYNHFDGKEALFLAVSTRFRDRYLSVLKARVDSADPMEELEAFVARSLEFVEEHRVECAAYLRESLLSSEDAGHSALHIPAAEYARLHTPFILELLAAGAQQGRLCDAVDIEELAWVLQSLLRTLIAEWLGASTPTSLRQRARRALRWLLLGVLCKS